MAITNDELFEDLKQFINAKIDGVESSLETRIDGVESSLGKRLDRVESRLDGVESRLDDMDTKLDTVIEDIGGEVVQLQKVSKKHDVRISRLEAKAA